MARKSHHNHRSLTGGPAQMSHQVLVFWIVSLTSLINALLQVL